MSEGKTIVGILTAFGVGYMMAAQGGKEGLDDVVAAARELQASGEFAALLGAVRRHVGDTLQILGKRVVGYSDEPLSMITLLDQARQRDGSDPLDL